MINPCGLLVAAEKTEEDKEAWSAWVQIYIDVLTEEAASGAALWDFVFEVSLKRQVLIALNGKKQCCEPTLPGISFTLIQDLTFTELTIKQGFAGGND